MMTRAEHIEKGRASLIPECCIMWWVDHDIRDFSREQILAPCQYVPCPDCTEGQRFVQIHICDQERQFRGEPCPDCGYLEGANRAFVRQPSGPTPDRAEKDT